MPFLELSRLVCGECLLLQRFGGALKRGCMLYIVTGNDFYISFNLPSNPVPLYIYIYTSQKF